MAVESSVDWSPIKAKTLAFSIVERVRRALFEGSLRSGDRLGTEMSLAESFGVSRMVVRDALRSLEALGVLDIRVGGRGGAFIAQSNPDRLMDAIAIQLQLIGLSKAEVVDSQIAVEVAAAELAARDATEEDIAELRRLHAAASVLRDQPDEFREATSAFHLALVRASHNRVLLAQYNALSFFVEPLLSGRTTVDIARRASAAQAAILEKIVQHDSEGARAMMHARLNAIRENLVVAPADEDQAAAVPLRRADHRPASAEPSSS